MTSPELRKLMKKQTRWLIILVYLLWGSSAFAGEIVDYSDFIRQVFAVHPEIQQQKAKVESAEANIARFELHGYPLFRLEGPIQTRTVSRERQGLPCQYTHLGELQTK